MSNFIPQGPTIPPSGVFSDLNIQPGITQVNTIIADTADIQNLSTANATLNTLTLPFQSVTSDNLENVTLNSRQGIVIMTNFTCPAMDNNQVTVFDSYVKSSSVIMVSILGTSLSSAYTLNTESITNGSFIIQLSNVTSSDINDDTVTVAFLVLS